jgi:hypothetical protein
VIARPPVPVRLELSSGRRGLVHLSFPDERSPTPRVRYSYTASSGECRGRTFTGWTTAVTGCALHDEFERPLYHPVPNRRNPEYADFRPAVLRNLDAPVQYGAPKARAGLSSPRDLGLGAPPTSARWRAPRRGRPGDARLRSARRLAEPPLLLDTPRRTGAETNDFCISNVLLSSVGGAHAPTGEPG